MKALLDTNIIIHREAGKILNQDIGILFKWLDKAKYQKYIHPITIAELNKNLNQVTVDTFNIKMDSYERLFTVAPMSSRVQEVSDKFDKDTNDKNDSILLNEVFNDRVDILISEDRKIHTKATELGIADRVFKINSFLEKVYSENPELVGYSVLSVQKKLFGELNLQDPFFDSLREDYPGFDRWFNQKSNEKAYVTLNEENNRLLSFLYIKKEDLDESYIDIEPRFQQKRRLKIGTFKVVSNGVKLGERFIKIIFDNALVQKVDEIYVTIFKKRDEQLRLINLLEDWGFRLFGKKGNNGELVYTRSLSPDFNPLAPKETFPYIGINQNIFLVPIHPDYHTDLLPDSYLKTESPENFVEHEPHRNAISKVYISRSIERGVNSGDIIVFYRTAQAGSGYYTSVITTIGIIEGKIDGIKNEEEFIQKCRKRSVFSDAELKKWWNWNPRYRPFIINFLYVHSFPLGKRMNRKALLDSGIITGADNELRGFKKITKEQFLTIIEKTNTNEGLIIN